MGPEHRAGQWRARGRAGQDVGGDAVDQSGTGRERHPQVDRGGRNHAGQQRPGRPSGVQADGEPLRALGVGDLAPAPGGRGVGVVQVDENERHLMEGVVLLHRRQQPVANRPGGAHQVPPGVHRTCRRVIVEQEPPAAPGEENAGTSDVAGLHDTSSPSRAVGLDQPRLSHCSAFAAPTS